MLLEVAEVVSVRDGIAKVRCETKQSCGGCAAKASCGAHTLSELGGGEQEHLLLRVAVSQEVKAGQYIEIGLQERSMILTALLLYIAPLTALVLSAVVSAQWFDAEWLQAMVIFSCTALSFILIRPISTKLATRKHFQPHFIRVLGKPITLSDTKFY